MLVVVILCFRMSHHSQRPADPTNHIVTSDNVLRQTKGNKSLFGRRKRAKVGAVIVGVLVAGVMLFVYLNPLERDSDSTQAEQVPTLQQSLGSALDSLKQNPPAKNAALADQLSYYDKLVGAYADTKDYKNATSTFEKRVSISTQGLTYNYYMDAAKYYHELDDQARAAEAVNSAIKVVPKAGDPEAGYSQKTILQQIQASRKELGL